MLTVFEVCIVRVSSNRVLAATGQYLALFCSILIRIAGRQPTVWVLAALLGAPCLGNASTEVDGGNVIMDYFKDSTDETASATVMEQEVRGDGLFSSKLSRLNLTLSMTRGLEMNLDDSDFSLKLGGRVYIDLAHYFNDKNDLGGNGIGLRTILVEMVGTLSPDWPFRFSWGGFTEGGRVNASGVKLDDAYLRYLGFERTVLTIGQHTEPFSLEEQTSSLHTVFMERALPNAFAPGPTVGISAATGGERWFAVAGFFWENLTSFKDEGSQGHGVTVNLAASPIRSDDRVIHLGASFSRRDLGSGANVFFRNRPESGLTTVRYVNTGTIEGAHGINRLGLDAAGIWGPWSVQGEYIQTWVGRGTGFRDVVFNGWYVFLSWFPTGEMRNYLDNGIFGRIKPLHDFGAIQLTARYSSIDLTDADITGGKEQNLTLGINWYLHEQFRLMLNYIYVSTDANANDIGTVEGNDHPHILQARIQMNF